MEKADLIQVLQGLGAVDDGLEAAQLPTPAAPASA